MRFPAIISFSLPPLLSSYPLSSFTNFPPSPSCIADSYSTSQPFTSSCKQYILYLSNLLPFLLFFSLLTPLCFSFFFSKSPLSSPLSHPSPWPGPPTDAHSAAPLFMAALTPPARPLHSRRPLDVPTARPLYSRRPWRSQRDHSSERQPFNV